MPYKNPQEQREYQRRWIAKRREDWFRGQICLHCESSEELELHHQDPTQKVSHRIWSWSKVRREEELRKCVVLCKECHYTQDTRRRSETNYRSPLAKLTSADAAAIRERREESSLALAEEFEVSPRAIRWIWKGANYKTRNAGYLE